MIDARIRIRNPEGFLRRVARELTGRGRLTAHGGSLAQWFGHPGESVELELTDHNVDLFCRALDQGGIRWALGEILVKCEGRLALRFFDRFKLNARVDTELLSPEFLDAQIQAGLLKGWTFAVQPTAGASAREAPPPA
ncbi:MAG: hypothetical protein AMXMBFR33_68340 [Candidatus Xenobia bacterium]